MLRFDMGAWRVRINGRRLAVILVITCTITPVFNVLTSEMSARSALQGLVDGLIIPPLVAGFWTDLSLSSAIVLVLFLLGRGLGQVVTRQDPRRLVASLGDAHLAYALPFFVVLAVTIQVALKMNRMIGVNVLRYTRPASIISPERRSASSCSSTSRARRSSPSGWAAPRTSTCCGAAWTT